MSGFAVLGLISIVPFQPFCLEEPLWNYQCLCQMGCKTLAQSTLLYIFLKLLIKVTLSKCFRGTIHSQEYLIYIYTKPNLCVCLCVCVCLFLSSLMHGHNFERICIGMWHPYTLRMVMGVSRWTSCVRRHRRRPRRRCARKFDVQVRRRHVHHHPGQQ